MKKLTGEIEFEKAIEVHLLANGYETVAAKSFDRARAIFPSVAIEFIQKSQPDEWEKLQKLLGDKTSEQVITDLSKWLDQYGALAVMRHGFKCFGRQLRIASFKAAHGLNTEMSARYAANRLGITRQLHFSDRYPNDSLDVTLSLNGVPFATLELKNQMSQQSVAHAEKQYRDDRDPRDPVFEFKKRTLVHFAVDTNAVRMTTKLAGQATQFLPFDKGVDGRAGNPPDLSGRNYATAYLWEEVLERQSILDILARFLHLQQGEKRDGAGRTVKTESLIFPRYHQLQAVRQLVASAKAEGPGNNYLVEHSAGSGKSNTIGWLAHRLASLHTDDNERVFDSVVVVTDRLVLDQQLQDTIYQFEHKQGVVERIEGSSQELYAALTNARPIIITTLQKFPHVTRHLEKLTGEAGAAFPTRRCAVIVDEAHSSQGGDAAAALKGVLGGEDLKQRAREDAASNDDADLEALYREMAARAQQPNLSFFAFTATPKHKTLKFFGRDGTAAHRYTMRQAIEEGFILDVLSHYVSYHRYYKLLLASGDDPSVERKKAARALTRFADLHPTNLSQKTEVIVEHFWNFTRHKIGGQAKAMVVNGSRLEAVRYKRHFDRYIQAKGYEIRTLVAFSGEVVDDELPGEVFTEDSINKPIRSKEIPQQFATPTFQVLLVADKFQTGFDQPLLHTMYVNKRLAGIQAVQTLSRLNRTHPFKEDCFVLDFVNDPAEIQAAFEVYYEGAAIGNESDPNQMYAIQHELVAAGIFHVDELEDFCEVYFKPKARQSAGDHATMNALLDIGVARFIAMRAEHPEEAEEWVGKAQAFRNLYAFLSQIIPYQDSSLEKLYVFLRYFTAKLPRRDDSGAYQFDEEVRLEYYRLQKISEGSISPASGRGEALDGPTAVGSGVARPEEVALSQLIDILNERFGTDFTPADQLFFDQIVQAALEDEVLKSAAGANPGEKFQMVFQSLLRDLFLDRMDQNEAIFVRFMNDDNFRRLATQHLSAEVFDRFRDSLASGLVDVPIERPALRLVSNPAPVDRYKTFVPFYELSAAAGGFGEGHEVIDEAASWVQVDDQRLVEGMFVVKVTGRSMEPLIPNDSYCLFRPVPAGTREGRVLLVELVDNIDSETGLRYTVKRYRSNKGAAGESWEHEAIRLEPDSSDFEPISVDLELANQLRLIGEFVAVI